MLMIVRNQQEFDECVKMGRRPDCVDGELHVHGDLSVSVREAARLTAFGKVRVDAYDSTTVTAYDDVEVSATGNVFVRAMGNTIVRADGRAIVAAYEKTVVMARGDAQVHAYGGRIIARDRALVSHIGNEPCVICAYDGAVVSGGDNAIITAHDHVCVNTCGKARVFAYGASRVIARGRIHVTTGKYATVVVRGKDQCITDGDGTVIVVDITTPEGWCAYYGAQIKDGVAILFKAVDDYYRSDHLFQYLPGAMPEAPDWDGGAKECGGGLHFCASPSDAQTYFAKATKFIACPVRLDEIIVQRYPMFASKVKAPRVCAPCWEVDITGRKI